MHDMDMSDTNATFAMMIPYLHFTRGDALWLEKIAPTSPGGGAVAGACMFLFALAAFERLYAAWSTSMRAQWAAMYVLSPFVYATYPLWILLLIICVSYSAQPIMNPKRGKSGSVDSADSVGKAKLESQHRASRTLRVPAHHPAVHMVPRYPARVPLHRRVNPTLCAHVSGDVRSVSLLPFLYACWTNTPAL